MRYMSYISYIYTVYNNIYNRRKKEGPTLEKMPKGKEAQ
jgi:hypothetical protein